MLCEFKGASIRGGGGGGGGAFKRKGRFLIFFVYQAVPLIVDKDPFA